MRTKIILALVALMISSQIVNILTGYSLVTLGIMPRSLQGLFGIIFAPWIHQNIIHLLGNLIILIVLSWLTMLHGIRYYLIASFFIMLVGGILLWCVGRPAYHIGASGWIFGLWGVLLGNAYYQRTLYNLFIAGVLLLFYSGFIWGLLPSKQTSFEGHITGVLSGILFSYFYINYAKK